MIAIDTSALVSFFHDCKSPAADAVELALEQGYGILPPVVLSEMLSDHRLSKEVCNLLISLPSLPLLKNYWERVGYLRASILRRGLKARLADTMIAQFCIDHALPLITADADYKHFQRYGHLKLESLV